MSIPSPPDPVPRLLRACDVEPQPVCWLWPGRLPLGKLTIFDGDPDRGKSLVALDLAARLTAGRPFPDGSPSPGPANALILNAEDGVADTVVPRLKGFGADLRRVYPLAAHGPGAPAGPLCLPRHAAVLDEILGQTDARLAVFDPVLAFLERGAFGGNDSAVRHVLGGLAALAEKHRCAMLLVRHLNKRGGLRALYRGAGPIAFLAVCRAAWLVAADPEQPRRRVLAAQKNNLAAPPPSLAYEVTDSAQGPVVNWLGTTEQTADDLVAGAPKAQAPQRPRDRARDWLQDFLREGPRAIQAVRAAAEDAGLAERTLQRVKAELGVRSARASRKGWTVTYWLLPGQELPDGVEPPKGEPDLPEWMSDPADGGF